jgi:hypothetical protein
MVKKAGRPAKVAPKAPEAEKPTPGASLVPVLKSTALSLDIGPKVVAILADAARFAEESEELKRSAKEKDYEGLKLMTMGIVRAARADSSIDLSAVFGEAKDAGKVRLNNQLYFAMGYKAPMDVGKGKVRFTWTPNVAPFVEAESDADPARVKKNTVRSNLAHLLTKCIHTAIHIVENKVEVKEDKKSGTLLLSGPTIKQHFGEASVLLNEKQNVQTLNRKGEVTGTKPLKAKPSYSEIARLGAEAHGKKFEKRVDSRAVGQDPHKHIADLCASMVKALEKMPKPLNDVSRKALESAQSAIEAVLEA